MTRTSHNRRSGGRGGFRRGGGGIVQPLVSFSAGGGGTFTRSSEASYYTAPLGGAGVTSIAWAGSNAIREDKVDGVSGGYLFEGAQSNLCFYSEDLNQASWIKTGASVSGTTAVAPDGDADACTVAFTASATDMVMRPVSGTANATTYVTTVFVRKTTGTGNVRLRVVDRNAAVLVSSDIAISTTWKRVEYVIAWGTGVATPEVGIINDAAGTAQNVEVWGFSVVSGASLTCPASYIRTTSAAVTRALDRLTFADSPDLMRAGRWKYRFSHLGTNAENLTLFPAYSFATATQDYVGLATNDRVNTVVATVNKIVGSALTFAARNQIMEATVDIGASTIGITGATTGNGVSAAGAATVWTAGHLAVGSERTGLSAGYGRVWEPYAA